MGDRYSKYDNVYDTPEDRAREREMLQKFYKLTIRHVTHTTMVSGTQNSPHNPRGMKYKRLMVQGVRAR